MNFDQKNILLPRNPDYYCSEASLGKYLGDLRLKFHSYKKVVMVFYREDEILFVDRPTVGSECIVGDSLGNITQRGSNLKKIKKLLKKNDLKLITKYYNEPEEQDKWSLDAPFTLSVGKRS